jgi:hypothetical protein
MISILQATLVDVDSIMNFIHYEWKENHILSYNKDFFLYEFKNNDKLNIIIAKNQIGEIIAFFGYFYYNNLDNPDMAGSIWKVSSEAEDQLLGMKVRNYFVKTLKPNFFATPGPGIHMKSVYKIMRMDWFCMQQYYLVNYDINSFKLLRNPPKIIRGKFYDKDISIKQATEREELKEYKFNTKVVPFKDINYINKKYLNHPIYKYDVYYIKVGNIISNIFICRLACNNSDCVYKIVDFFGELEYIKEITTFLSDYIEKYNIEYIDFTCHGYDEEKILNSGFGKVYFDDDNIIVPNYFEPFIQKNVPVYCVADKTDKIFRQHKADGDMDRPHKMKYLQ